MLKTFMNGEWIYAEPTVFLLIVYLAIFARFKVHDKFLEE